MVADERRTYELPDRLRLNEWAMSGDWTVGGQPAILNSAGGRIAHPFHARDLHLVMGPERAGEPVRFRVRLDGEPPGPARGVDTDNQGAGTGTETRLYQLIRQPGSIVDRTFEITFLDRGVHAYVFTFWIESG